MKNTANHLFKRVAIKTVIGGNITVNMIAFLSPNFVRKVVFKFLSIRGEAETYCPKDWGSSIP